MDLSVNLEGVKLNIRVSVLLETKKGFVFEDAGGGFCFPVGGRIKINETSIEAAKREMKEELGIELDNLKYVATLENFFSEKMPFHEINIIYYAKKDKVDLSDGFLIFDAETIKDEIIKPECIKEMIINNDFSKHHIIQKD